MLYNEAIKYLGLELPVTKDDIKTAYRRMARQYHPDAGGDAEDFIELQMAYETALNYSPWQDTVHQTEQQSYSNDQSYNVPVDHMLITAISVIAVLVAVVYLAYNPELRWTIMQACQTINPLYIVVAAGAVAILLSGRSVPLGVTICMLVALVVVVTWPGSGSQTLPDLDSMFAGLNNVTDVIHSLDQLNI